MDEDSLELPRGWEDELLSRGDLVRSFEALAGVDHFWAEAYRGRIRWFELRPSSAWRHFDRAETKAASAPLSMERIIRELILHVWRLENVLLEGPADSKLIPANVRILDPRQLLPEEALQVFAELRFAVDVRSFVGGMLQLHLQNDARAKESFAELVLEDGGTEPGLRALAHLGLAAAHANEDDDAEADRHLETVRSLAPSIRDSLMQGRVASLLSAFYAVREEETEARRWEGLILQRLPSPLRTKEAFLRRGTHVFERCLAADRLLVL